MLDPFGITAERLSSYRARWNPMADLDADDLGNIETADLIADALIVTDGSDRHWSDSAHTLVRGVTLHVASWHAYRGCRHLPTVRRLLLHGSLDAKIGAKAQRNKDDEVAPARLDALRVDMESN